MDDLEKKSSEEYEEFKSLLLSIKKTFTNKKVVSFYPLFIEVYDKNASLEDSCMILRFDNTRVDITKFDDYFKSAKLEFYVYDRGCYKKTKKLVGVFKIGFGQEVSLVKKY